MSEHNHRTVVPGCYRCEIGQDESLHSLVDLVKDLHAEIEGLEGEIDGLRLDLKDSHDIELALADEIADLAKEKERLRQTVDEYLTLFYDTADESNGRLRDVRRLESEIERLETELRSVRSENELLHAEIDRLRVDIHALTHRPASTYYGYR